jgi:hypothetical protein
VVAVSLFSILQQLEVDTVCPRISNSLVVNAHLVP